jgi:hypothetical protein
VRGASSKNGKFEGSLKLNDINQPLKKNGGHNYNVI